MPSNSSAVSDDASSGGGSGGSGGGGGGATLKKGPWTAAEDAILMEYVKKHGEGNWNAVQKNSGLSRCGKSCRLRWANHLRPNLKKGSFSPEEERLILELHSKLGNKWARMAAQLPGRTDNEIKNYWNTRVKRRLRSGLPLYPQEIERQAAVYHMQPSNHHQQQSHHSSQSPSSPLSFSSLNHQKPLFDPMNISSLNRHTITQSQAHHGYKRFRGSNVGFTHPFSSPSSSSSTSTLFNQSFSSQLLPPPHLQFNSSSFELNPPPPPILRPFEPDAMVPPCSSFSMKLELPSSQLPQPVAPASAASTAAVLGVSNDLILPSMARSNSGLLDDMLKEAQAMEGGEEGRREEILQSQDEKDGLDGFLSHAPPCGFVFSESPVTPSLGGSARHWDDSSSAHSSMGVKMKKEQPDEINSVDHDDDLSSFFNIGPSAMLVSDLYNDCGGGGGSGGGEMSNGQSSVVTDEDIGLEMRQLPSSSLSTTTAPAVATTVGNAGDHDWAIDAWNNMPEMC